MKNIIKYNKLIEEIVFDYVKRYYKEIYQEEAERNDFDIMNYVKLYLQLQKNKYNIIACS